ncbi:cuticle protein 2 [Eurytemora carolleeae]|uniref:cuticle protein 2 n=1 Tax=Eurytemora carolleeae TaxID=1294199 RepID=UPI000C77DB3A|nr:cuticle protein 2 [Eurytemora carolleeae]|eukprot:XP_023326382.1 cuticle protein 2-like [Eurytemora affinis]
MKFLVLAACVAVSAGQLVTYPNGAVVPADEPAVAAARAAHLATHTGVVYAAHPNGALTYANGVYPTAAYAYAGYPTGYAYGGLVAHPNGAVVPVDEPAVAAAKAEHFAAHGYPYAAAAYPYAAAGYPYAAYAAGYPYGYSGLVAHPNGAVVPVEPADVQAARAEHLAAHASA